MEMIKAQSAPKKRSSRGSIEAAAELERCSRLLAYVFPEGTFGRQGFDLPIHVDKDVEPGANQKICCDRPGLRFCERDLARPVDEILTSMLHQMVHVADQLRGVDDVYPGGFHCLQFKMSAEEVGLVVKTTDWRRGIVVTSPGSELLPLFKDVRLDETVLSPYRERYVKVITKPWACTWPSQNINWKALPHEMRLYMPDSTPQPPWPVLHKKVGKVQYLWRREEIVPRLRFTGKWLRSLGFHVDTQFELKAAPGYIFLRALGDVAPQRVPSEQ